MQCKKCGSGKTQRLEVVFDAGTQNSTTRSKTAGIGYIAGSLGLGGTVTKTTGTSQSVLTQKSAPPVKKSLKWPVIGILFGLLSLSGSTGWAMFGLLLMGAGGYFGYTAVQFNTKKWPSLYQCWLDSWICHQCGHIYQP